MPMNRFSQGKIYVLICLLTGLRYIGSTTQLYLSSRRSSHWNCYRLYLEGAYPYYSAFEVLSGESFVIQLLENFPCNNINELRARERFYIETTECVNKNTPGRSKHEWNNIPMICDKCGGGFTQCHRNRHNLSNKHLSKINLPLLNLEDSTNKILSPA